MDEETVNGITLSFSPIQLIRVFLNDCSLLLLRGLGVSLCRFSEVSDIPKSRTAIGSALKAGYLNSNIRCH